VGHHCGPRIVRVDDVEYLLTELMTYKKEEELFQQDGGVAFTDLRDMTWERVFTDCFDVVGWRDGFVILNNDTKEGLSFKKVHLRDENHVP
jgi:hypothetical protein